MLYIRRSCYWYSWIDIVSTVFLFFFTLSLISADHQAVCFFFAICIVTATGAFAASSTAFLKMLHFCSSALSNFSSNSYAYFLHVSSFLNLYVRIDSNFMFFDFGIFVSVLLFVFILEILNNGRCQFHSLFLLWCQVCNRLLSVRF